MISMMPLQLGNAVYLNHGHHYERSANNPLFGSWATKEGYGRNAKVKQLGENPVVFVHLCMEDGKLLPVFTYIWMGPCTHTYRSHII